MNLKITFSKKMRILFLMIFFGISASELSFSADKTFSQKIEWKTDANAFEYKVEVQNIESGKSIFIKTEKTVAEVKLSSGKYQYRVFAYDFLGKEAGVSPWTSFDVYKASKPKINMVEKTVQLPKKGGVSIAVDISDVNANSKFELVNDSLKGSLDSKDGMDTDSETGTVKKLNFKDLPPGKWRLKVTNASGLSSLSDPIEIVGDKTFTEEELNKIREEAINDAKKSYSVEKLTKEMEAEERRQIREKEAEEKRLERERLEEEKRLAKEEAEQKKREAEEEKIHQAEEKRLAKEEAKRAKAEWKAAHPYVYKDLIFEVGAGGTFALYDGSIKDYTGRNLSMSVMAKIAWLPFSLYEKNKIGAEFSFLNQNFEGEETAYKIKLDTSVFDLRAVWRRKLSQKTYFMAKGGFGLNIFEKHLDYNYSSQTRSAPDDKTFVYPTVSFGASAFFTPWKFLVCEVGLDYNHVFASDMATGFVTPYACAGFRF